MSLTWYLCGIWRRPIKIELFVFSFHTTGFGPFKLIVLAFSVCLVSRWGECLFVYFAWDVWRKSKRTCLPSRFYYVFPGLWSSRNVLIMMPLVCNYKHLRATYMKNCLMEFEPMGISRLLWKRGPLNIKSWSSFEVSMFLFAYTFKALSFEQQGQHLLLMHGVKTGLWGRRREDYNSHLPIPF